MKRSGREKEGRPARSAGALRPSTLARRARSSQNGGQHHLGKREIGDKIERETRFYITSLAWLACQIGPVIRGHWAIENSLHWVMDMVFRDDECRVRTDHAPANFTTLKHMAHNLIRQAPGNFDWLATGTEQLTPQAAAGAGRTPG